MLTLEIILNGEHYDLPNPCLEKEKPILKTLEKGIKHIFQQVEIDFPEHDIQVIWDEDHKRLFYSCDTLAHNIIAESLHKHNIGMDW